MRIGILSSPESWYFHDLRRAAQERGHEVHLLGFTTMNSSIREGQCEVASASCSWSDLHGVIVRSMPPGSLEQVVCRMDMLALYQSARGYVLNPARCLETAIDKYLTTVKLARAGLPTPATIACQTVADAEIAFQQLGGDVVVKPLFGGEGRGITRVSDVDIAHRVFKTLTQLGAVLYLQEFVPHLGYDVRVLVVGRRTYAVKRRHADDWRTNVSRGARSEVHLLSPQEEQLALQAARAVGAPLAGIDLLSSVSGDLYVLEVNAVPGWQALGRTLGVDIGGEVIVLLEELVDNHG